MLLKCHNSLKTFWNMPYLDTTFLTIPYHLTDVTTEFSDTYEPSRIIYNHFSFWPGTTVSEVLRCNFSLTSPFLHIVLMPADFSYLEIDTPSAARVFFLWFYSCHHVCYNLQKPFGTDIHMLDMLIISDEPRDLLKQNDCFWQGRS
jgi:hypothetical protein